MKNKARNARILCVLLGVVVLLGGCRRAGVDAGEADRASKSTELESPAQTTFGVGETAEVKEIAVTFLGVTESAGSTYNKPAAGNVFVLCEFEIENDSENNVNISSMMCFDAYCDDCKAAYSLGALVEKGNQNQLDGTVAPDKKLRGVVGYELPKDWKKLEIKFTPDFWSGSDVFFVATH